MSKQNLSTPEIPQYKKLLNDVVQLIQQGRQRVATEINSNANSDLKIKHYYLLMFDF